MQVSTSGLKKLSRSDQTAFHWGTDTETNKRSLLFQLISERTSGWKSRSETLLGNNWLHLHAEPTDKTASRHAWLIEMQMSMASEITAFSLRAQRMMVDNGDATPSNGVRPLLRVLDGFYVTATAEQLSSELGLALPSIFMSKNRGTACMMIATRIPHAAIPLQQALTPTTAHALIKALVAMLEHEFSQRRIVVRHVTPTNLWALPLDDVYDGVRIGAHSFSRTDTGSWLPQTLVTAWYSRERDLREDTFSERFQFKWLRNAPGIDRFSSHQGQLLVSLCAALLTVLISSNVATTRAVTDLLATLLPTEEQLLDLIEAAADNSDVAMPIQRYAAGLVRLRRAIRNTQNTPGWSARVQSALDNIHPPLRDGVLPLNARFMPSFASVLSASNNSAVDGIQRPLIVQ